MSGGLASWQVKCARVVNEHIRKIYSAFMMVWYMQWTAPRLTGGAELPLGAPAVGWAASTLRSVGHYRLTGSQAPCPVAGSTTHSSSVSTNFRPSGAPPCVRAACHDQHAMLEFSGPGKQRGEKGWKVEPCPAVVNAGARYGVLLGTLLVGE